MLARPDKHLCIECGLRYGADTFAYYHGHIDNGPAYWCDRGLLCSSQCSLAHHRKRMTEGTLSHAPAPDPLESEPIFKL